MKNKSISNLLKLLSAVALFAVTLSVPAFAENESVPYKSYTYWEGYSQKVPKETAEMYSVKKIIDFPAESDLRHICFDSNWNLYVLDAAESGITVVDSNYRIVNSISNAVYNGQTVDFRGAEGIYVNKSGDIFVADTDNRRIVIFDSDGNVKKLVNRPDSLLLPDDFNFTPIKVLEDERRYLYVLCDGCYYGALKFSPEYEFLGFYGANKVKVSVASALRNFTKELFSTTEKRMNDVQKLPYTFLNFCIDDDGFIFTTTVSPDSLSGGQVRRLNPSGDNILSHKFNFKKISGDNFCFGDIAGVKNSENVTKNNHFSAIAVSGNFFYILDNNTGRIFVYDFECNLINAFSGGFGNGTQQGVFKNPTSIAVNEKGDIFVSDSEKKTITVFETTDYGKSVMRADTLRMRGESDKAEEYWREVLSQDANNQLAYIGLGEAAVMRDDYKTAMYYSKLGLDQETYVRARSEIIKSTLKGNFLLCFITAFVILAALSALIVVTTKRNTVMIRNRVIGTAFSSLVHPKASFTNIVDKKYGSVVIATVLLLMFFVTRTAKDINAGFMYVVTDESSYNVIYTFLGTVVLMLLWVGVNWCVCVLFEGKGRLKDIYITSCYSLLPLVINYLLFILLSYYVAPSGVSFLSLLNNLSIFYFIVMIIVSVMTVHEFDFKRAVLATLLSVLGMAIAGFMIFMALILAQDFLSFLLSVIQEIAFR